MNVPTSNPVDHPNARLYTYTAYGLGIRSQLWLPELVTAQAAGDVMISWGTHDGWPKALGGLIRPITERAYLYWDGVGRFLVRNGREIIVDPWPGAGESVLRTYLLGPVLAALLHQRGLLVLHASAVAVNGAAILFLGKSGQGKSTTAAALYARGHGIVCDDVAAVQLAVDGPTVLPGVPQLRLLTDAAAALGDLPGAVLPCEGNGDPDKIPHRADRSFPQGPLPLQRIYVLTEGPCDGSERLSPGDAVVMLARHSYIVNATEATGTNSSHFQQCVGLARCVPVCHLTRRRSLPALNDLARLVEEDLARNSS